MGVLPSTGLLSYLTLVNNSTGDWSITIVEIRQGCLLSTIIFNIFLERTMNDDVEEHDGKVSIGGRNITNLRFADDTVALAEEEQELDDLVDSRQNCTRWTV